ARLSARNRINSFPQLLRSSTAMSGRTADPSEAEAAAAEAAEAAVVEEGRVVEPAVVVEPAAVRPVAVPVGLVEEADRRGAVAHDERRRVVVGVVPAVAGPEVAVVPEVVA